MSRSLRLTLGLAVLLGAATRCPAQTRVAPIYSLPPPGTWVEYRWKSTGPDGQEQKGTLRISFVGQKVVRDIPCCWIEVRNESGGGKPLYRLRKFLVPRPAFAADRSLPDEALEGYDRRARGGPAVKLTARRLRQFLGMGFEGEGAGLRPAAHRETVKTGLGQFTTRCVWARGTFGERPLDYRGWLTAEVPFGWARFEVRETTGRGPSRRVFTAEAVKAGTGAKSELDETRAK